MESEKNASIGLPVYNGREKLEDALDSLLNQTFSNFEFIISDNASIDGTDEICKRYLNKDNRVSYIRHDRNRVGGISTKSHIRLARQLNQGISGLIFPHMPLTRWCAKNLGAKLFLKNLDHFITINIGSQILLLIDFIRLLGKKKGKRS